MRTAGSDFTPSYVGLASAGELPERVRAAVEMLRCCTLCPRNCRVDRTSGQLGVCGVGARAVVASWGPHFGEEPPLVGIGGSGTIFMAGCNLRCIFCQNYHISQEWRTFESEAQLATTKTRLAGIMLALQSQGCHNINFVTPTHQVPQILEALEIAVQEGLRLPLVYNCGGYESLETLRLLDGIIDIYMPDIKYGSNETARELSGVEGYWDRCREAIREMHRQVGDLVVQPGAHGVSVATRGLLIRHLVLPGGLAGTAEVVRFIAEEISRDSYVNIMDQYRPCYKAYAHPVLSRRLSRQEFEEAVALARSAGLWRFAD